MKRSYSTDLTNAEWECIKPYVPPPNNRGRPRIHGTRIILDAIFYVLRSGCPWRLLPRDLERLGRPSTTTSAHGGSTAPGKGSTRQFASSCALSSDEIPNPVPGLWTRSRQRQAEWAERHGDTTVV